MHLFKNLSLICLAGVLGACSTATTFTPAVSGSAGATGGGTYAVTQNGVTRALPAPGGTASGTSIQFWGPSDQKGHMYENADVVAIAIMDVVTDETFAGISGTPSTNVPVSGSGVFTGDFSSVYYRGGTTNNAWNATGAFTTSVSFSSGSVTGSGTGTFNSSLDVNGTIDGTNFNGTATFAATEYTGAATVPMTGGFYGVSTVAGIYQGADTTGVFWGQ